MSQLLAALGLQEPPERKVPNRVHAAMGFVNMMRTTSLRPPEYDGGPPIEVPQARKEREAYVAALECLKLYFSGESFTVDAAPYHGEDPEPPPAPELAKIPDPSPSPMPVGV
jgi:hypothetical protein